LFGSQERVWIKRANDGCGVKQQSCCLNRLTVRLLRYRRSGGRLSHPFSVFRTQRQKISHTPDPQQHAQHPGCFVWPVAAAAAAAMAAALDCCCCWCSFGGLGQICLCLYCHLSRVVAEQLFVPYVSSGVDCCCCCCCCCCHSAAWSAASDHLCSHARPL
jgi:hypothetical protein